MLNTPYNVQQELLNSNTKKVKSVNKDNFSTQEKVILNKAINVFNRKKNQQNIIDEDEVEEEQQEKMDGDKKQGNTGIEKKRSIGQLIRKIKMKVVGKKIIGMTISRMKKNLQPLHYYLINDKSIIVDRSQIKQDRKAMLKLKSLSVCMLQQDNGDINDTFLTDQAPLYLRLIELIQNSPPIKKLQILMKNVPLLSPSSTFKLLWDFVHMMLILLYFFMIPIHISQSIQFSTLTSPTIAEAAPYMLILDMIVNMNTGYYDKGRAVTNSWEIIINYVKNNIVTDMFSVMPFISYQFMNANLDLSSEKTLDRFVERLLLLFFFLKINSFTQIFNKLEERSNLSRRMSNIIKLLKLLFTIILIAHLFACIWLFISRLEQEQDTFSWTDNLDISQQEWFEKYINAFYFSVVTMTTVGYGDVLPKSKQEKALATIIIMMSCGVFAYSVNEVGNIFHDLSKNDNTIKQNTQIINQFMREHKINQGLQYQVRKYLEYFWHEEQERDQKAEQEIIQTLSENLRAELLLEANKIVLKDSPIFLKNFSEKVIQKTVALISEQKFQPEQIIMRRDTMDDCEIFFIAKGQVELVSESVYPGHMQSEFFVMKVLSAGQCFGTESFFTGQRRHLSVRSCGFSTLLVIKRTDFIRLLKDFPEDYEQFCYIRDNMIFNSNQKQIDLCCSSCLSYQHYINDCPYLHYNANKRKSIAMYNKRNINSRREVVQRKPGNEGRHTLKQVHMTKEFVKKYRGEDSEALNDYIDLFLDNEEEIDEESIPETSQEEQDDQIKNLMNRNQIVDCGVGGGAGVHVSSDASGSPKGGICTGNVNQGLCIIQEEGTNPTNGDAGQSQLQGQGQQSMPQPKKSTIDKPQLTNKRNSIMLKKESQQQPQQMLQNNLSRPVERKQTKQQSIVQANYYQEQIDQLRKMQNLVMQNITQQVDKSVKDMIDLEQQFDVFKNFLVYFPYNNLSYQVKLMSMEQKDRNLFLSKMHVLNRNGSRFKIRGSQEQGNDTPTLKKKTIMVVASEQEKIEKFKNQQTKFLQKEKSHNKLHSFTQDIVQEQGGDLSQSCGASRVGQNIQPISILSPFQQQREQNQIISNSSLNNLNQNSNINIYPINQNSNGFERGGVAKPPNEIILTEGETCPQEAKPKFIISSKDISGGLYLSQQNSQQQKQFQKKFKQQEQFTN